MNKLRNTSVILLLSLLVACRSQVQPQEEALFQKSFDRIRTSNSLPALTVGVFSGDSIYSISCSGFKRNGSDESVDPANMFHLGSNTKAFIGFAAASMVEEGIIDWESKFFDVCQDYLESAYPEYHDITLIQLLRHQAGIISKDTEFRELMLPTMGNDSVTDRSSLIKWALGYHGFTGGFQYSNTGYVMAAEMMERVSGKSWKEILTDRIFKPLSIEGSFGWPAINDTSQTWGHYTEPGLDEFIPHEPDDLYYLSRMGLGPAGDMSMRASDYIGFLQENLKGYQGNGSILTSESYQLIHKGQGYGLGWGMAEAIHGLKNVSIHSGSAGTFYCQAFLFKDNDLGMFFFTNCNPANPRIISDAILDEVIKEFKRP